MYMWFTLVSFVTGMYCNIYDVTNISMLISSDCVLDNCVCLLVDCGS